MERSPELREALGNLVRNAQAPFSQATTMPPLLYRSDEAHALELQRIFAKDWLCPGLAAEIPSTGDYLTFSIGNQPVFIIRGNDGGIRSFSNVCRHRMMALLEGSGTCPSRIVCPYHAWTYDLEGRLVGAAHMEGRDPAFNKENIHLPPVRTEVWQGWIYISLNPDAPSVGSLLSELLPLVSPYQMENYIPVVRQDHLWDTNWKVLDENFMEGYHLPVAHRATVGAWFPVRDTVFPERCFEAFTYQTFTKDENAKYGRAHPDNTRLEKKQRYTSILPTVFPTHMYVLAPDHLWYLSLRPKSAGQVHVRFGVAVAPEVHRALGDGLEQWVRDLVDFFDRVNAEDRAIVEGIYRGAMAPLAASGQLGWLERELHDFMRYLARKLATEPDPYVPA